MISVCPVQQTVNRLQVSHNATIHQNITHLKFVSQLEHIETIICIEVNGVNINCVLCVVVHKDNNKNLLVLK